jgi:hypothetical protein
MSRAMNLSVNQSEVVKICGDMGIATTSIEPLLPKGTRVVCLNADGAAALRNKMRASMIEGAVTRMPRSLRTAPR